MDSKLISVSSDGLDNQSLMRQNSKAKPKPNYLSNSNLRGSVTSLNPKEKLKASERGMRDMKCGFLLYPFPAITTFQLGTERMRHSKLRNM